MCQLGLNEPYRVAGVKQPIVRVYTRTDIQDCIAIEIIVGRGSS